MSRAIAFFQPGWADWEAGPVLAGLRRYLGRKISIATPDGKPAESIGGVRAAADLAFAEVKPDEDAILLLIGSEAWFEFQDEKLFALLRRANEQGLPIGAICAGTLAAARAGIFATHAHTSNGQAFLREHLPAGYAGAELYRDVKHAVRDGNLVSASGAAPNTFAAEMFRLAAPDGQVADAFEAMMTEELASRVR
jgi:putative intracellular protease/amidase